MTTVNNKTCGIAAIKHIGFKQNPKNNS